MGNDVDPEGEPLAVVLLNQPTGGTTTVNSDGTITFIPNEGFEGTVSIHYLVEDQFGETDDATVTIEVEPSFLFDSFTNFSESNFAESSIAKRLIDHQLPVSKQVMSQKIYTLAPEPIFSGYARPGTQIIGRIYDASGSLVGESRSSTDAGGNWMMQFSGAKGHDFYRIEFEQVSAGAADIYGYIGLNPSDNSYQSMEPMTSYDRPLSVNNAMETSQGSLKSAHQNNSNSHGLGN